MRRALRAPKIDRRANELPGSSQPSVSEDRDRRNLVWLVLACALITAIVCVFSWVATVGLLPRRALASGESMLAADYSPWEGYRVLNLDVVRLATAASQGDAPWQVDDTVAVAEVTLPPSTAIQITSQATPLPTLEPTQIPPTRRPRLPGPTNTLPPTIPAVTSTSTTAPTSPPPPPPPPAPTSPPPVPTSPPPVSETPTSTPADTPTPTETPTATPTETPTATATMTPTSYEAEAPGNTLSGSAVVDMSACSACSGGGEVRWFGNGAANYVTINNINVPATGSYTLTIDYITAEVRSFYLSINGGPGIVVNVAAGPNWTTPVSTSTTVTLNAGSNSIRFYNDSAWAPDLDRIIVQ